MAKVATLTTDMVVDSTKFEIGLRKADRSLASNSAKWNRRLSHIDRGFGRVGKSVKRLARSFNPLGIAIGAVAGTGGLGLLVKNSLDAADSIAKTADKIGLGTDALQELRYAAERAGVAQSTLDMGLQRFVRRTAEAAQGTGEAQGALKQLGIQLRDANGNLRAGDVLLQDVADAMAAIPNQGERVRLAFKLFDSEGVAMVNMLTDGGAAMQQVRDDARRLGIVMDEQLIRNAEKAKDELDILGKVISMQVTSAVAEFAPEIERLARGLSDSIPHLVDWVNGWARWAGIVDKTPREKMREVFAEAKKVKAEIAELEAARAQQLKNMPTIGSFVADQTLEKIEEKKKHFAALRAYYFELRELDQAGRTPPPSTNSGGGGGGGAYNLTALKDAAEKAKFELALLNSGLSDVDKQAVRVAKSSGLISENLEIPKSAKDEFKALVVAMRDLDTAQRGATVTKANRTATEEYADTLKDLRGLLDAGAISQETFNRAMERADDVLRNQTATALDRYAEAATDAMAQIDDATVNAFKSMEDALVDFVKNGKMDFRSLADSIIDDMIRIQIRQSITGPLAGMVADSGGVNGVVSGMLNGLFSGGGGGSFRMEQNPHAWGGQRANGGPVTTGRAYLVGERGPEIMVPNVSGTVLPNSALAKAGGGGPTIYADMRGASVEAVQRLERWVASIDGQLESRAIGAMADARARGFGG